jgi:hypothetical protein
MKIHFLTYGDDKYSTPKKRIEKEANYFGLFDTINIWGENDLDDTFKKNHKWLFDKEDKGGWWIWKPYICHKMLNMLEENDILVYCDAGNAINKQGIDQFNEYIKTLQMSDLGCLAFKMPQYGSEFKWTKKEIFDYFDVTNKKTITHTDQFTTCALIFKKNKNSVEFLDKWLKTVSDDDRLYDKDYRVTQFKDFVQNTAEQSTFSVLAKVNGVIEIHSDHTYPPKKNLDKPFLCTRSRKPNGHKDAHKLIKGLHIPP